MLAYNGSIPGPTLKVRQGSAITVLAENRGDVQATVHWHGLRLDNRFDGTRETQAPVEVGESFEYRLEFPDPGVYWYHPHIREDYAQELGLYGNILVTPEDPGYWAPAHRELAVTLDDIRLEGGRIAAFDPQSVSHSAMGRFGNTMLVAGETSLELAAQLGEVVRFHFTNTANARVFRVGFRGARMKLVGGDSGRCEREELVDSVTVSPSERVVVDVLFDTPGPATLEHRPPGAVHELGTVVVSDEPATPGPAAAFETLRVDGELAAARAGLDAYLAAEPDETLAFVAEMSLPMPEDDPHAAHGAHSAHGGGMEHDAPAPGDGIEWEDEMPDMNRATTSANTRWKLVDPQTGAANDQIQWRFRVGERVKIRLVNELESDHPMYHPFHVHGAGRFLVLARDGVVEPNLMWKDTVLVRADEVVDVLLELSHAGRWMVHCHIAEHHESGMHFGFDVRP